MARFCTGCGSELNENASFCTSCGKAFDTQPATQNTMQNNTVTQQAPKAKTQSAQPVYMPDMNAGVVGTGYYFGMMLLFAVPVIGWILCLATAFTNKNQSKKNFARAMLIWLVIGLILSLLMFFAIQWIGNMAVEYMNTYINEATGGALGEMGSLSELGELMQQLENLESLEGLEGLEGLDLEQLEQLNQ